MERIVPQFLRPAAVTKLISARSMGDFDDRLQL